MIAAFSMTGPAVFGQVDDEVISGVQFNFTPPGARSLGLGGAFLAVANDATAAFTNPAGITNLTQQEVSLEGRSFSTSTLFTLGGRAQCTGGQCAADGASGVGFDTRDGLLFSETDDDTLGVSFASYVMPVGDFRLALYRHEVVNFESSFRSEGAFLEITEGGICQPSFFSNGFVDVDTVLGCLRLFPVDTQIDLDIENFGASFAYKFGESFSLGVSVNFYQFDIAARTNRYDVTLAVDQATLIGAGGFLGPPRFEPANVFATQVQDGDDDQIGVNVGFLWEVNQYFNIGGVFRDGAEFDYRYTISCGPSDPEFCATQVDPSGQVSDSAVFNLPQVWGVGIAIKPTDNLTITADYDNVEYSALTDNFTVLADANNTPADFTVDDADEFHLGIEYVFASLRNPISIRAGVWEDPAHQTRYTGDNPPTSIILWRGSNLADDELHYAAGLGFIIGENFSIDLAGDFSERVDIAALSAVYRF